MEGVTRVLLVTILMFAKTSISQNCVPLRQCSSLMTLLENKNQLLTQHQVGTIDIFTILRNASCGFEGKDPLVWCQDAEIEDGDEIVDRGVLINRDIAPEFHCAGILTLMHLDPSQGLGSMRTSRLQGPIYFNIQKAKRNRKFKMENTIFNDQIIIYKTKCNDGFSKHFKIPNFQESRIDSAKWRLQTLDF